MLFKLKKTLLLLSILLFSIETFAVPADKRPITVKQINGKTLTFILSGDEKLNWANTLDGYTLLHNESGDWVYAVLDGRNNLVPSSVLACNEEERSAEENSFLSSINKNISFSDEQFNSIITAYDEANRPSPILKVMNTNIPTVASDSVLVILVSYSDKPYTYTQADFYNYFAQPNFNGTGSLRDYYLDQSGGLFDMKFRVVGPYTLPNTSAYYANRGEQLAKDAISAADNDVDYTHFANVSNTSGISRVGCVFVMYAGTPQSSTGNTSEVWPHQSNISSTFMKDDVRFSHYVCGPEMQYNYGSTSFAAIGTMCHEFGHALGLPDFYDTGNNSSGSSTNVVSTGDYDLMCSGCYNNNQATPPNWSAYEKLFTDWILKMDTLTDSRDSLSLPVISGGNDTAYLVKVSGSQEFFTLEARRKAGWDAYLPAAGILVHHGNMSKINSWINNGYNSINTSASNRGWFIEPSTGVTSHGTTAQAPFVSNSGVNYFTNTSRNKISKINGTVINNIAFTDMHKVNDSLYMFNFNSSLPVLETGTGSGQTMTSFNVGGKVLYRGQESYTSRGIVYSLDEECLFDEDFAVYDNDMTDTINFNTLTISNLQRGETYYYRAFIKNSAGTHLGPVKSIVTVSGLGNVGIQSAANVDSTSATLRASLTYKGSAAFINKGFVYTTDADILPDLDNSASIILTDSTTGLFTYNLTGLQRGRTYYVRAFITNGYGTAYSTKTSFTTLYPAIVQNTIDCQTTEVCQGVQPAIITGEQPDGGFGNFTYLWQQRKQTGTWEDADPTAVTGNNQKDYQPSVLEDSTYFRRIVYSDGLISSTSNAILIDVRISRGGHIVYSEDSVLYGQEGLMTLTSYRGDIVDWEISDDDGASYSSLNNNSDTYNVTFLENGRFTFRVKVQIDACPEAYSDTKVVLVGNVGLNAVDNTFSLNIAPNPVSDGIFRITSDLTNADELVITNILGQVIYREENVNLQNKTFNLGYVENGTYTLTVKADGKTAKEKLIINK